MALETNALDLRSLWPSCAEAATGASRTIAAIATIIARRLRGSDRNKGKTPSGYYITANLTFPRPEEALTPVVSIEWLVNRKISQIQGFQPLILVGIGLGQTATLRSNGRLCPNSGV
jgi:hypothetical protein